MNNGKVETILKGQRNINCIDESCGCHNLANSSLDNPNSMYCCVKCWGESYDMIDCEYTIESKTLSKIFMEWFNN